MHTNYHHQLSIKSVNRGHRLYLNSFLLFIFAPIHHFVWIFSISILLTVFKISYCPHQWCIYHVHWWESQFIVSWTRWIVLCIEVFLPFLPIVYLPYVFMRVVVYCVFNQTNCFLYKSFLTSLTDGVLVMCTDESHSSSGHCVLDYMDSFFSRNLFQQYLWILFITLSL